MRTVRAPGADSAGRRVGGSAGSVSEPRRRTVSRRLEANGDDRGANRNGLLSPTATQRGQSKNEMRSVHGQRSESSWRRGQKWCRRPRQGLVRRASCTLFVCRTRAVPAHAGAVGRSMAGSGGGEHLQRWSNLLPARRRADCSLRVERERGDAVENSVWEASRFFFRFDGQIGGRGVVDRRNGLEVRWQAHGAFRSREGTGLVG
jgi:hypothetical protein